LAWLLLLVPGLLLHGPTSASEAPPLPDRAPVSAETRGRLAKAAQDAALAPWQRAFMQEMARNVASGAATRPSQSPRATALRSTASAVDDGTWTALAIPSPAERCYHTAAYDPVHDRMVVFGGFGAGDVWSLSLAGSPAWTALTPAGVPPPARSWHTAIYDPLRQRMVVFGGYDGADTFNDVWSLSLSASPAWTELTPAGTPPSGRLGHTAIYDPVRDRMVVFGGSRANYPALPLNDIWALSLSGTPAWTELTPAGTPPAPRSHHTAIYDPVRDRMVVFGGFRSETSDVWALSLTGSPAWTEIAPAGALPTGRYYHTAIYDPVRDRMVVFGGIDVDYLTRDVLALSLSGSPTWTMLAPAGTLPSRRYGQSAIYDPVRDRMLVFAGTDNDYLLNELWTLEWSGSASDVAVAFDLMPNALNLTSPCLWVTGFLEPTLPYAAGSIDIVSIRLNGSVPVDPTAPTALGDHDGNGIPDLMVKFNRAAVELTVSDGDDVPVTVTGTVNAHSFSGANRVRVRRAVVSAPAAGRHLTGGGVTEVRWETPSGVTVESVALLQSLDGGVMWSVIARGQPNSGSYAWNVPSAAALQAKVAVVLVETSDLSGDVVDGVLGVSGTFAIEAVVAAGDPRSARLALAVRGPMPDPASGGRLSVEFALRDDSPASLELVDVSGRVLTSKQVGMLGPGTHGLDVSESGPLRPGIYFLRLAQGGSEVRARAAIIR
jgi:hypothetical protein